MIPFRFTDEFLARIDAAAESSGMKRTEFVRSAIESAMGFVGEPKAAKIPTPKSVSGPVAHRDPEAQRQSKVIDEWAEKSPGFVECPHPSRTPAGHGKFRCRLCKVVL